MDDTSLQRKLLQMEKEVRSLKIAHERGLGVVKMWIKIAYSETAYSNGYLKIKPVDSTNFFAVALPVFVPVQKVADLTIMSDGTWRFKVASSASIGYDFYVVANNQFTWTMEAA
jgi:hypothetical protein